MAPKPQIINQQIIKNNEAHTVYHKGVAIPPGEQRIFDGANVPGQMAPNPKFKVEPPKQPEFDPVAVLGNNVAGVKSMLTDLTDEQLKAVGEAESAGEKRKGVMEAVQAEALRRADEAQGDDDKPSTPEGAEGGEGDESTAD